MMDLNQAIKTLEELRRNDPVVQRGRNGELTTAFKIFWDSCPDETTYAKHTAGLLITPTLLYYMVEHPIWMRKEEDGGVSTADDGKKDGADDGADPAASKKDTDKKGGKNAAHK